MNTYKIEIVCTDKTMVGVTGIFESKKAADTFADRIISAMEAEGRCMFYRKIKLKK